MVVIRQSGCIRAKEVVFGQSGCVRIIVVIFGKVVVLGKKWLFSDKIVVFE